MTAPFSQFPPPVAQPCGCYHERIETLMSSWTATSYRLVPCAVHRLNPEE